MKNNQIESNLDNLKSRSLGIEIKDNDKFVVFSDLHIGDGSRNDDFIRNSDLFTYVLKNNYLNNNFNLILNGDIEDVQRFDINKIYDRWDKVFKLFDKFDKKNMLLKNIGNHDDELIYDEIHKNKYNLSESIRLYTGNIDILVFHGHQVSKYYTNHKKFIRFFLKYIANPLGISNYSVSRDSRRKFAVEQNVYNYAREKRIIAIVGHTHRPLFESLSKLDILKYKIEEMCRLYITAASDKKIEIEDFIRSYKTEIKSFSNKEKKKSLKDTLYGENIVLPCLFNSGCVIGKRGITSLEITKKEIALIHYFDKNVSRKFLNYENVPVQIDDTNYYRVVLNIDSLDYINTKTKIL